MKNDLERDVFNGDIGRIRSITRKDDEFNVIIDFGFGRIVEYNREQMSDVELAYATTIHKSQGSEYAVVIIPLLNEAFILLQRNLIYTAVTRGKTKVIFVGQRQAFYTGIHNAKMSDRNTVLGRLIAQSA